MFVNVDDSGLRLGDRKERSCRHHKPRFDPVYLAKGHTGNLLPFEIEKALRNCAVGRWRKDKDTTSCEWGCLEWLGCIFHVDSPPTVPLGCGCCCCCCL